MSTYYNKLKHPLTSVTVKATGNVYTVNLFINHQNAGSIRAYEEEIKDFLFLLTNDVWSVHRTNIKGKLILTTFDETLKPEDVLISDTGEIVTYQELCKDAEQHNLKPSLEEESMEELISHAIMLLGITRSSAIELINNIIRTKNFAREPWTIETISKEIDKKGKKNEPL